MVVWYANVVLFAWAWGSELPCGALKLSRVLEKKKVSVSGCLRGMFVCSLVFALNKKHSSLPANLLPSHSSNAPLPAQNTHTYLFGEAHTHRLTHRSICRHHRQMQHPPNACQVPQLYVAAAGTSTHAALSLTTLTSPTIPIADRATK